MYSKPALSGGGMDRKSVARAHFLLLVFVSKEGRVMKW